jgi:hypothetical protein
MQESRPQNLISWSDIVRYALISAINLAILIVGIAIGVVLSPHIEKTASAAQQFGPAQPTPALTAATPPKINQVSTDLSAGKIGAYLLLAHHIQSDELVVNGIDLLKLHDAELHLLAGFLGNDAIQRAVNESRVEEIYQVTAPKTTAAPATPAPNK